MGGPLFQAGQQWQVNQQWAQEASWKQSVPLLWYRRPQAVLLSQEADHGLSQGLQCFSNYWYSSSCFQETLRKIESNPQDSAQTEGHVELSCAAISPIWLNTSALSNSHSLSVFLTSFLILGQDHLNKIPFLALINSRSTHCFVDSEFVDTHHLKTSATPPVALHLFDSSFNSTISEIANLPIIFSTSDYMNLDFYITLLDSSCSLVLRYNWLTWHNPLIDWVNRSINFHPSLQENLAPSRVVDNILLASLFFLDTPLQSSDSVVSIPVYETSVSNFKRPNIAIIGATAFLHALKLPGSHNFKLCLCFLNIQANSAKLAETPNLSNVPSEYHKFADIFSKTKAETLSPHPSYNLKINLEESAQPLVSPIYSFLASEQEALKEFIEENLNTGFIQPISSPHSALVLFIKKKDGSLCLCINFHGLNYISKKNCYPLPLISNLLDSPYKARVYSKINLHHAYYLVRITNSNEWKTAFRTCYESFK